MEQEKAAQKEVLRSTQAANDARRLPDEQEARLGAREQNLQKELAELEANREALAAAVDDSARARYDRLVRSKGHDL